MATEELLLNADIIWDETSVPGSLRGLIAPGAVVPIKLGFSATALTDAASIVTDASSGPVFTVTIAGNRTLANPSNLVIGLTYYWVITQAAGGNHTLAYDTLFTFAGGTPPTLSTAAGAVDVLTAVYDGLKLRAQLTKAYA